MPSEYTLVEIEVDEVLVRRLLSPVPGVKAVRPSDEDARSAGDLRGTTTGAVRTRGETAVPSSPWPGAPAEWGQEEDEPGLLGTRKRKLLAAGGGVLGLGGLAGGAYFLLKRRGGNDVDRGPDVDENRHELAKAAAASPFGGGRTGPADAPDHEVGVREGPTPLAGDRNPPMDTAALVGLAFLIASATLVRRYLARQVTDPELEGDDEAEEEVAATATASPEADD